MQKHESQPFCIRRKSQEQLTWDRQQPTPALPGSLICIGSRQMCRYDRFDAVWPKSMVSQEDRVWTCVSRPQASFWRRFPYVFSREHGLTASSNGAINEFQMRGCLEPVPPPGGSQWNRMGLLLDVFPFILVNWVQNERIYLLSCVLESDWLIPQKH